MLSESFIASSSAAPSNTAPNTSLLKDAGIFFHSFQPQPALRSTFKKSVTPPNCLVTSPSHIFAAQVEKAVVHVYSRETGKQEATIAFPERIHSLALAAENTVLVLGTAGGSIILWETCTGRQLATPQSHLQVVTALAVDLSSNFLLSGSADSTVLVWNLTGLLSFHASAASLSEAHAPLRTLSAHRGTITSVITGHSTGTMNIAVTASKDKTAVLWDYHSGHLLRTFLLASTPLCLTLDPADRAFFIGFEDGSVQLVNLYATNDMKPVSSMHDPSLSPVAVQPPASSRWGTQFSTVGAAHCVALSYDGTILISGHATGRILQWDISNGSQLSQLADYGVPITNIIFLPPTGFPVQKPVRLKTPRIVKPRPHEAFSSSKGQLNGNYTFTAQFPVALHAGDEVHSDIHQALTEPGFPATMLAEGIAELASWNSHSTIAASVHEDSEYMPLDGATDGQQASDEISHLKEQIAHLKHLQAVSNQQFKLLLEERKRARREEEEARERRLRKMKRRELRAQDEWRALSTQGSAASMEKVVVAGEDDSLSGTSSSSVASMSDNV